MAGQLGTKLDDGKLGYAFMNFLVGSDPPGAARPPGNAAGFGGRRVRGLARQGSDTPAVVREESGFSEEQDVLRRPEVAHLLETPPQQEARRDALVGYRSLITASPGFIDDDDFDMAEFV